MLYPVEVSTREARDPEFAVEQLDGNPPDSVARRSAAYRLPAHPVAALERKGRETGDRSAYRHLAQRDNDLFGNAIPQVVLIGI